MIGQELFRHGVEALAFNGVGIMAVQDQVVAAISAPVSLPSSPCLYRRLFKRPLDLVLVVLAAPVIVPLVLFLALMVLCDGGKPFYSQDRIGRNGRHYRIWKLRSMVVHADERLADYLEQNPEARAEWDSTQKLRDDPRITRFGRLLRKCSLDELPQLWNVFRGDMSLVGPRPMMPEQQAMYPGDAYYRMRPGITGFWQISERNQSSFAARAFYDERYERAVSLWTDIKVLFQTFAVVVRGTGC